MGLYKSVNLFKCKIIVSYPEINLHFCINLFQNRTMKEYTPIFGVAIILIIMVFRKKTASSDHSDVDDYDHQDDFDFD